MSKASKDRKDRNDLKEKNDLNEQIEKASADVLDETTDVVDEAPAEAVKATAEATAEAAAAAPKKPKGRSIPYEKRKSLYGLGFISLWIIGTIYFFIMPVVESIIYSFCNTLPNTDGSGGMHLEFIGLDNYINAFTVHKTYSLSLVEVLQNTFLKTPLILVFSIFIAIILNQKFKGRVFARAVFFLPVIIATGPVIDIINGNMSSGGYSGGSEQFNSLFETDLVGDLLTYLGIYNISDKLTEIINTLTSDIFNLVWNSGIQILLFLAALQNISPSAKEAAQMEGATAWEYFWKITLPSISPMIVASLVYTVVDSFVAPDNSVMEILLNKSSSWEFGYQAAMLWAYFLIVAAFLGIILAIVNKFVYYEVG